MFSLCSSLIFTDGSWEILHIRPACAYLDRQMFIWKSWVAGWELVLWKLSQVFTQVKRQTVKWLVQGSAWSGQHCSWLNECRPGPGLALLLVSGWQSRVWDVLKWEWLGYHVGNNIYVEHSPVLHDITILLARPRPPDGLCSTTLQTHFNEKHFFR